MKADFRRAQRRLRFGWQTGLGALLLAGLPLSCSNKPDATLRPDSTAGAAGSGGGSGGSGGSGGVGGIPGHGAVDTGPDISVGGGDPGPIENSGLGGAGGETTCAGEDHEAELVPIDMYIMLDRSLSMNGLTSTGDTKWESITDALEAFLSDPGSEGIGVGIQFFPANKPCTKNSDCGDDGSCYLKACRLNRSRDTTLPGLIPCVRDQDCEELLAGDTCVELGGCGDQSCVSIGSSCNNDIECKAVTSSVCSSQTVCTLSDYQTPVVPIGALPGAKSALLDALTAYTPAQSPFGLTPTGPALQGAVAYAQAWGADHPSRRSIVVLATDGAPTGGCSPSRRAEIAAVASMGAGASVPVQTYTIGVFSPADPNNPNPDDTEGPNTIKAIAAAGKGQAFVLTDQGDVAAQFIEALNTVRGHGLSCEFQIPQSGDGKDIDYGKVNVAFTPKKGEEARVIPYLDDRSLCDDDGGWYYVTDPSSHTPRSIVACSATCEELMGSVTGNVNIQVGCATVRRDPVE